MQGYIDSHGWTGDPLCGMCPASGWTWRFTSYPASPCAWNRGLVWSGSGQHLSLSTRSQAASSNRRRGTFCCRQRGLIGGEPLWRVSPRWYGLIHWTQAFCGEQSLLTLPHAFRWSEAELVMDYPWWYVLEQVLLVDPSPGKLPMKHLKEQDSNGPDITLGCVCFPFENLRWHVEWCPDTRPQ